MLAGRGVTGPKSLFEGPHDFVQLFDQRIDFHTADRGLTAVEQTYLKDYVHSFTGRSSSMRCWRSAPRTICTATTSHG